MANEISSFPDVYIHIMSGKLYIYTFISVCVVYFIVLSVQKKYNNYHARRRAKDSKLFAGISIEFGFLILIRRLLWF